MELIPGRVSQCESKCMTAEQICHRLKMEVEELQEKQVKIDNSKCDQQHYDRFKDNLQ